jgi:hypothetical protein
VYLAALSGVKSANQIITTQTTLVNDADMRFAVAANSLYEFHAHIKFASPGGGDWKTSFTVPAGASAEFNRVGLNLSSQPTSGTNWLDTDSVPSQGSGAGTPLTTDFFGWVVTASTAGNLILQWAQNTSNAGNTTLFKNSYLTGRRIA